MKFVEQTLFVTNGELEKHNTLRGLINGLSLNWQKTIYIQEVNDIDCAYLIPRNT